MESHQPLRKEKKNPDILVAIVSWNFPILSPRAS